MINVIANKIYRLRAYNDCNPPYVYCLYAPSLPVYKGMIQNQEHIGIVIEDPKQANNIYSIISDHSLNNEEIVSRLIGKYELVTFWTLDVISGFKDVLFETRNEQEVNINYPFDKNPVKHYSQVRLENELYNTTIESFKNYNMTQKQTQGDKNTKLINSNLDWHYNGYKICKHNHVLLIKLYGKFYYVYSPISLIYSKDKKKKITYIGIILINEQKMLMGKKTNIIQCVSSSKDTIIKKTILSKLKEYLLLNKTDLKDNSNLIRIEAEQYKQLVLNDVRISSDDSNDSCILLQFSRNIIEILDYIQAYQDNQIIKPERIRSSKEKAARENIIKGKSVIYNGIRIPNFFNVKSQFHKNCYIKYKTGEIGFTVDLSNHNVFLKFKIPSVNKSFKTIAVNDIITVNVTKWYTIDDVEEYGKKDEVLAIAIVSQIKKLYAPIYNKGYTLDSFFKKVSELKKHSRIKALYEKISNAYPFTEESYADYCTGMRYLYNYIDNPELLNTDNAINSSTDSINSPSTKICDFDYCNYNGTKGIFYTITNEESIINSNIPLNGIQARFIKKFAYIPNSEELKKLLSLLVVDVDLTTSKISVECFGTSKRSYVFNIIVLNYQFSFLSEPKGTALLYARIIATVCNRVFYNNEHNPSNSYHISDNKTLKGPINKKGLVMLEYSESKKNTNHSMIYNKPNEENTSYTKGIHIRRGHWHYYWYGAHNSPERHKELRWVEETIVNRDASNIVIAL